MKKTMKLSKTMEIVMDAMFIAMVFAATWLINIRLPLVGSGGLIHLGNVPLFIGAMLFGRKTGAISGAFGMALFDVVSGWTAWAPFTFVILKQPIIFSYVCCYMKMITSSITICSL